MALTTLWLTEIVTACKAEMEAEFTHGAIGTGDTTPASGDTILEEEVFRDPTDEFDDAPSTSAVASFRVLTTEANGNTLEEVGFFDEVEVVVDNCEAADWTDDAEMTSSLNATTYIEGSNSLNLVKDAGAAITASTDKTTTSADFTGRTFYMWLYIKDATMYAKLNATNCLGIRFGSDNGNYYVYTRDKADLAAGWNRVAFTTATADSTTGTPVVTACDYTYIAIKADAAGTTWSAGDLMMDNINVIGGNMWTHNTYTDITKTSDIQCFFDVQCTFTVTEDTS